MKTKYILLTLAFSAGTLAGCKLGAPKLPDPPPGATEGGAYFCCDAKPCVISVDGDCKSPVQWCSETETEDDGTVKCAKW